MNLPEGLYLGLSPAESLAIMDAQGIPWVDFTSGGAGDPADWAKNIIRATCSRLGVREAIDDIGDEVTVEELLDKYYGELDFLW